MYVGIGSCPIGDAVGVTCTVLAALMVVTLMYCLYSSLKNKLYI